MRVVDVDVVAVVVGVRMKTDTLVTGIATFDAALISMRGLLRTHMTSLVAYLACGITKALIMG